MGEQISTQKIPVLEKLVSQIPKQIKRGIILAFPATIMPGYPIIKGSLGRKNVVLGNKCTFKVTSGKIVEINQNILMLQTHMKNADVLVPILHSLS